MTRRNGNALLRWLTHFQSFLPPTRRVFSRPDEKYNHRDYEDVVVNLIIVCDRAR